MSRIIPDLPEWVPLQMVMERWNIPTPLEMIQYLKKGLQPYGITRQPLKCPIYACEYYYLISAITFLDRKNRNGYKQRIEELEIRAKEIVPAEVESIGRMEEVIHSWKHVCHPNTCNSYFIQAYKDFMPEDPLEELSKLLQGSFYKNGEILSFEYEHELPVDPDLTGGEAVKIQWKGNNNQLVYLFHLLRDKGLLPCRFELSNKQLAHFIYNNFKNKKGENFQCEKSIIQKLSDYSGQNPSSPKKEELLKGIVEKVEKIY